MSAFRQNLAKRHHVTAVIFLACAYVCIKIAILIPALRLNFFGVLFNGLQLINNLIFGEPLTKDLFAPKLASIAPWSSDYGLHLWFPLRILLIVWFFNLLRGVVRTLPQSAIDEEQIFREGSERWSVQQRLKSAGLFSIAHLSNFIYLVFYPVGTLIVLAVFGWILMCVYQNALRQYRNRQAAVFEVSTYHATYNYYVFVVLIFILVPLFMR